MPARGEPRGKTWEEYLKPAISFAEARFKKRNEDIAAIRARRLNENVVEIPEAYRKLSRPYHAPHVKMLIRQGQSLIAAELPRPHVPPRGEGVKHQENADLREKWLREAILQAMHGQPVWHQITDAIAADKQAVWTMMTRPNRFATAQYDGEDDEEYNDRAEAHRRNNFPFVMEHVATESFYPLSYEDGGLAEVIEITEHEKTALYERYDREIRRSAVGPEIGAGRSSVGGACRLARYFNLDRFVYMVDGIVVRRGKHLYGRPPFFTANFSTTSMKTPGLETEGLVDPILLLQDELEEAETMQKNWAYMSAFPAWELVPINEESIPTYDQKEPIRWAPGMTIEPPPGYRWQVVQLPPVGQDLQSRIKALTEQIERAALAEILAGKGAANLSGPTALTLSAFARSVFGPAMANLASEFDRMAEFMFRIIEREYPATPIPVWHIEGKKWLELGKEDIDGYYVVRHSLAPILPMEQIQRAIASTQQQAIGAISMRHHREEGLGIEDPEVMDREVRVEQLRNSSQYGQLLWSKFAERIHLQDHPAPPSPQELLGGQPPGQGTPAQPMVQPGGPGIPMVAGVGQPIAPGMPAPAGTTMNPPPPPAPAPMGG